MLRNSTAAQPVNSTDSTLLSSPPQEISQHIWMADYNTKKTLASHNGGATFGYSVLLDGTSIRAAAAVPGDPQAAYYLTTGNTVWKTQNGGQSFSRLTGFSVSGGLATDIFVNPTNPLDIYVNWFQDPNSAVYHSTDGGISWSAGGSIPYNVVRGSRALINHRGTLIVAVSRGGAGPGCGGGYDAVLWRSTNGGLTWSKVWNTCGRFSWARSLTFSRDNPSIWYATVSDLYGTNPSYQGIVRSADDGLNWVYKPITGISDHTEVWDVAADRQNANIVLALNGAGLHKSTNGGDTWSQVFSHSGDKSGWRLRADPNYSGVFWLVGSNVGDSNGGGLFKSLDYGQTWTRVYTGNVVGGVCCDMTHPPAMATLDISPPAALPESSVFNSGSNDACFGSAYTNSQGYKGRPINTRTGGYDYSVEDISIPTSAGPLTFRRTYSSMTTGIYTSTLGYGWTHSLDTRLVFSNTVGGAPGMVMFKAHTANLYQFFDHGGHSYAPYPGLCATLAWNAGPPQTYTLKDNAQRAYVFDQTGKLIEYQDPQEHALEYQYDPISGRLSQVSDETGARHLALSYDGQGRIESVSDHAGREVSFAYSPTTGDLIYASDVMSTMWAYQYEDSLHPHFLTRVIDPGGITLERTEYNSQGRAVKQ